MDVRIFTTGGTIDKVYFDALSEFQIGESPMESIFHEANITLDYEINSLMRKDSLELLESDRQTILNAVQQCAEEAVLITHGTDTMPKTADVLKSVHGKTVVLTGAMQPARLRATDAIFNVGFALAAAQTLPQGVYITMNGRVFEAGNVRKNRDASRFEAL